MHDASLAAYCAVKERVTVDSGMQLMQARSRGPQQVLPIEP
jgi:hypothetical protein